MEEVIRQLRDPTQKFNVAANPLPEGDSVTFLQMFTVDDIPVNYFRLSKYIPTVQTLPDIATYGLLCLVPFLSLSPIRISATDAKGSSQQSYQPADRPAVKAEGDFLQEFAARAHLVAYGKKGCLAISESIVRGEFATVLNADSWANFIVGTEPLFHRNRFLFISPIERDNLTDLRSIPCW